MKKNICNVVWVDDDIENIYPEIGLDGLKKKLKKTGIEVIGKARSFTEFEEVMRICYDRVDAVITDANFNKTSLAPANDDDFTGFIKMGQVIDSMNQKRVIPFYLYTAKQRYLNTFKNGELDYFTQNGRLFDKGGDCERMFERIKEDVEHINSPSFRIRKKYFNELEAASHIEGNEELLLKALLYDYSENRENIKDFNQMRQIAESIFDKCKEYRIIPPIDKLNEISQFLGKREYEKFITIDNQEIMPKPLARSLWYFLDITQDASHKKESLNLGVEKYVRETKNINLFRSLLYIAMDLCLWYKTCEEETKCSTFTPKWTYKEEPITEQVQEIKTSNQEIVPKYEYEGIVKKDDNKYYCGKYLLQYPKNGEYQEGDKIHIISSTEAKQSFFNIEGEEVNRFVFSSCIIKDSFQK